MKSYSPSINYIFQDKYSCIKNPMKISLILKVLIIVAHLFSKCIFKDSKRIVKEIVWLELSKLTLMSFACNSSLCMRLCFLLLSWQITFVVEVLFSLTSGYIFVPDCKHFIFFIAWRLTAWPRTMAWSFTSPFSARSAFLACSTATWKSHQSKLKNMKRNDAWLFLEFQITLHKFAECKHQGSWLLKFSLNQIEYLSDVEIPN